MKMRKVKSMYDCVKTAKFVRDSAKIDKKVQDCVIGHPPPWGPLQWFLRKLSFSHTDYHSYFDCPNNLCPQGEISDFVTDFGILFGANLYFGKIIRILNRRETNIKKSTQK